MNQSKSILANTVSAQNQLEKAGEISIIGSDSPKKKVLILGNSITMHGKKPEIGWNGNWGMAASAREKDYVHVLFDKAQTICHEVQFCVIQASRWERGFWEEEILTSYQPVAEFKPDIIIFRLGENVLDADCDKHSFEKNLKRFLDYFTVSDDTKWILTTCFWHHQIVDDGIRKIAEKANVPLLELGDFGELDEMKAIGLFEHIGVAAHPGDLGMRKIADVIWKPLKNYLKR